jgi:hypothetical protein
MSSNNKIKLEVYSASNFSDLMASPVFYSTATIALVLGFASIFGFLQSPDKLKSTVDVITQKVMVYQTEEAGREFIAAKHLPNEESIEKVLTEKVSTDRNSKPYQLVTDLLPQTLSDDFLSTTEGKGIQTLHLASFDYDITSKHFWSDLDIDDKHAMTLESQYKNADVLMIGVPVEPALIPKSGDSKYSLKLDRNYRI